LAGLVSLTVTVASGAAPAVESTVVDPLGGWQIAKVSAGLLVVIAAIVGTAAGLKRLKSFQATHGSHLKIIDGISVGTRDRIVLLQVDSQRVLVGISPGRIQPLHVLADQDGEQASFAELVEKAGADTVTSAGALR
jgi:flagellar protein FliO/FliZ